MLTKSEINQPDLSVLNSLNGLFHVFDPGGKAIEKNICSDALVGFISM